MIKNINYTTYCQPSNLVPHFWNYKIIDKEGSPDLPCIMILSEVFGWFRSLSKSQTYYSTGKSLPELVNGQLAISYDYLSDKLNFQKERIRRKLVKLEELGILSRNVRNIALEDGSRIKQLYLSIDQGFFKACFRNPELDIRVRTDEIASIDNSESIINSNQSPHYIQTKSPVFEDTPPFGGEHIRNKNINRSMKSNSLENNSEEKKLYDTKSEYNYNNTDKNNNSNDLEKESRVEQQTISADNKGFQQSKQRLLENFYPLSEEDCSILQSASGREFSLNAMNEILKNMSKRLTDRSFYSKKGFLAYMSQAFRYEKRQAVKINNTDFRIRSNLDASEQTLQIQEKYLTELEYSLQVSPEWYLKKKLASVLERDKAYNLLTSYKNLEVEQGGKCKLILNKHVNLTTNDKDIILSQIQATHEQVGSAGGYNSIEVLEIEMPKQKYKSFSKKNEDLDLKQKESPKQFGAWGKIRTLFAKSLGEQGDAIDYHWLSKLDADIDQKNNRIELKAPSEFIKSYIEEHYLLCMSDVAKQSGFELSAIEC